MTGQIPFVVKNLAEIQLHRLVISRPESRNSSLLTSIYPFGNVAVRQLSTLYVDALDDVAYP